jgi:hypothetical protein
MPESWIYPDWHPYYRLELRAMLARQGRREDPPDTDSATSDADDSDVGTEEGGGSGDAGSPHQPS